MTLRLLHLPSNSPKLPSIRTGHITYISSSNESAAVASLRDICYTAKKRAEDGLKRVKELKTGWNGLAEGFWEGVAGMWEEERVVLEAVLTRIEKGDTDW